MMGFGRVLLSRNGTNFGYGAKMMAIAAASELPFYGREISGSPHPIRQASVHCLRGGLRSPHEKETARSFQDPDNPHNRRTHHEGARRQFKSGQQQDYMVIRKRTDKQLQ